MKIDCGVMLALDGIQDAASAAEAAGYDALFTAETKYDPFLPVVLAAEHTNRIQIGTSIAVAFARNPMTLANLGYDLHRFSEGRFVLGLGSQIQPHIEKRFSMSWSRPAARMREMVAAIRTIWESWQEGTRLRFEGDFYTHTLMPPFFDPGPNPYGCPRVFVAAVGDKMTETVGEVGDGLFVHGFTTERYLRTSTLPALDRGLDRAGRSRADVEITIPIFVVTGNTEEQLATARKAVCQQISFYGSTPAYRPVLELHGWGEVQNELNRLTKENRWSQMGDVIDDEILDEFAIVGAPETIAAGINSRFGDIADRMSFYMPYDTDDGVLERIMTGLRAT